LPFEIYAENEKSGCVEQEARQFFQVREKGLIILSGKSFHAMPISAAKFSPRSILLLLSCGKMLSILRLMKP